MQDSCPFTRAIRFCIIICKVDEGPCGICGGQSGTGTGLSPSTSVSPVNFIPLVLHENGKAEKTSSSLS
jgi:hypothetical protein